MPAHQAPGRSRVGTVSSYRTMLPSRRQGFLQGAGVHSRAVLKLSVPKKGIRGQLGQMVPYPWKAQGNKGDEKRQKTKQNQNFKSSKTWNWGWQGEVPVKMGAGPLLGAGSFKPNPAMREMLSSPCWGWGNEAQMSNTLPHITQLVRGRADFWTQSDLKA